MSEAIIKIFYSYSRKDLDMRNTLEDHLSALRQANKISTWHDLELEAGTEWEPVILNKLDTADIILLLVSRNFIASKYCYGTELKRAIARHTEGTARVIPVILRPCDWNHADVPFSKLNVLPTHAKAITSWTDQEEAFTIVAQKIRETVDQLRAKKLAERQATEQEKQRLAQQEAEEAAERERIQRERQQAAEQERLRQAQLRQQQAAEAERLKQQELERQRQMQLEEAERKQRPTEIFEFQMATLRKKTETQSGVWGFGKKELITYSIDRTQKRADYFTERLSDRVVLEIVAIPAGRFQMGSTEYSDEQPVHQVAIAPFFLGKHPVTQAQWRVVAGLPKVNIELKPDPSGFKGGDRPVERVSWWEAVEFCDRLSNKTKRTYRLPSEAEWEYACRAGTTTPFHFGETITTDLANYRGTDWEIGSTTYPGNYGQGPKGIFREQTTSVGSFEVANAFGLYDMHGNVWEWCTDHWHENYNGAPTDGSAWLTKDENATRLLRGGSWYTDPRYCRSADRARLTPDGRNNYIGFRVVCVSSWAM